LTKSLRDINEKVRFAALSLNEILKDMIIEYVNSPKLDLGKLVNEFSTTLSKMNVATSRDLVLQWILLFEGLPTFNLSDHFMYDIFTQSAISRPDWSIGRRIRKDHRPVL
jgi:hypothetical protein